LLLKQQMVEDFKEFEVKKQGWLKKQSAGRRWWKNWKKRFCQAKLKGQQKILAYHTVSKNGKYTCKGFVDLCDVSVIERSGTCTQPQFELICPKRTWVFKCSDIASRDDWIDQIERIIWGIRHERLPSTKAVVEARGASFSELFCEKSEEIDLYGNDDTLAVNVDVLREQLSPAPQELTKKANLDDIWAKTLTLCEGADGGFDVYASESISPRFSLGS